MGGSGSKICTEIGNPLFPHHLRHTQGCFSELRCRDKASFHKVGEDNDDGGDLNKGNTILDYSLCAGTVLDTTHELTSLAITATHEVATVIVPVL